MGSNQEELITIPSYVDAHGRRVCSYMVDVCGATNASDEGWDRETHGPSPLDRVWDDLYEVAPRMAAYIEGQLAAQQASRVHAAQVEFAGALDSVVYILDAVKLLGASRDTIDKRIKACPEEYRPKFTTGPRRSRRRYYWSSAVACKHWWTATRQFTNPDPVDLSPTEPEPCEVTGEAYSSSDWLALEKELTGNSKKASRKRE